MNGLNEAKKIETIEYNTIFHWMYVVYTTRRWLSFYKIAMETRFVVFVVCNFHSRLFDFDCMTLIIPLVSSD